MNKFFDLIKETYRGKSILGILMHWQTFEHCKNLEGVMIDLGQVVIQAIINIGKLNLRNL